MRLPHLRDVAPLCTGCAEVQDRLFSAVASLGGRFSVGVGLFLFEFVKCNLQFLLMMAIFPAAFGYLGNIISVLFTG